MIPVDIVVAAIITVAALGPEQAASITQVASGGINPLKYKMLVDNVRSWFTQHPLYDNEGQPIVVPEWHFPARGRVKEQLARAKKIAEQHRTGAAEPAPARQAGVVGGHARGEEDRDRPGLRVRPAVRPVHRVRGDLSGRQADGDVGRPFDATDQAAFQLRPDERRLAALRRTRSTCPRSCSTRRAKTTRRQEPHRPHPPACARPCCRPTATWPPSTWRTR